jgi:hypothetical protein
VRFAPWFRRLSSLDFDKRATPPAASAVVEQRSDEARKSADSAPDRLTTGEFEDIVTYVRKMKLVDIKDVLDRLGRGSLKEDVLRAVEKSPHLKAHPGPQTIYLQWRVSA